MITAIALWSIVSNAADTPPQTWDLSHIYPTVEAFDAARDALPARLDTLQACEGTLDKGAAQLATCLDTLYGARQELNRLYTYAGNHRSVAMDDDSWQQRAGSVELLSSRLDQASSWFEPELQSLGEAKVESWLSAEPRLKSYAYPLRATLRHGAHVLPPAQEHLLALTGDMARGPSAAYTVFTTSELPWPNITVDGQEEALRPATFTRLRTHQDAAVRRQVFDTFFGTYGKYEATIGTLLSTEVQAHWFRAQARGYDSSVQAALDGEFLPVSTYDTLVEQTHAGRPTLQRYLRFRAKELGIEQLSYSDLYVPLVASDEAYPFQRSADACVAATKPLGKDYQQQLAAAMSAGWIDVAPGPNKVSGAYMDGAAYDVHPYVLLNHNDDWEGATTLCHEMGHAMHSVLSSKAQPYPTADYSTFIAEIASTFNEALLADELLRQAKTPEARRFLLVQQLENLRLTYFRQVQFAEFERQIHAKVEAGEPLTGAEMTRMYRTLLQETYGDAISLNESDAYEWAYIPHFYYDFYVWQYATSIAASSLLADQVLQGGKPERERYLDLLKAGASDDAAELLKRAGVDLSTPAPYQALFQRMDRILDELGAEK